MMQGDNYAGCAVEILPLDLVLDLTVGEHPVAEDLGDPVESLFPSVPAKQSRTQGHAVYVRGREV